VAENPLRITRVLHRRHDATTEENLEMTSARKRAALEALWDEAFRRAAEKGGNPEEHFRAMIQEALDSLVADGSVETAGLNGAGKMVYRARSSDDPS
jgi:hypothetical protein